MYIISTSLHRVCFSHRTKLAWPQSATRRCLHAPSARVMSAPLTRRLPFACQILFVAYIMRDRAHNCCRDSHLLPCSRPSRALCLHLTSSYATCLKSLCRHPCLAEKSNPLSHHRHRDKANQLPSYSNRASHKISTPSHRSLQSPSCRSLLCPTRKVDQAPSCRPSH